MKIKCVVVEEQEQYTLAVRTRCPVEEMSDVLGREYGKIVGHLQEIGVYPSGAPFVAYYNMDMSDLDIEAGFPVVKELEGKGDIQPSKIPAGKYVETTFTGPYTELSGVYESLMKWMEENNYQISGAAYEFYLNDPQKTKPEDLQTKIWITVG